MLLDLANAEYYGGNLLRVVEGTKQIANNRVAKLTASYILTGTFVALGDVLAARQTLRDLDGLAYGLKSSSSWTVWGEFCQKLVERGHAWLLEAEGNLGEAERRWRAGLALDEISHKAAFASANDPNGMARSRVLLVWAVGNADLAKNLRQQGRVAEAEYFARNALTILLQAFGRYSSHSAYAISELGWAVYESGRFTDAGALAQSAIVSYEQAGVVTESAGLASARSLLGSSLAARGRWPEALAIFEARDKAMSSDSAQYAKLGGRDPNWGIALLHTGQGKKGLSMLESIYRSRLNTGLSDTEYFTAEARGFYAMGLAADGQADKALFEFRGVMPVLLDEARRNGGEQGGAIARQMRLVWIVEAYMKLLADLRDSSALKDAGIDAIDESFRLADVARGSSVQRALAESAARAIPSEPALADLARREQDAGQRFGVLSDLRNRLLSAPLEQQLPKVIADLKRDIDALRIDRDKLKLELAQRFPDYANLIDPKPATLADVQAALSNGEALVSIYVAVDKTYVWAVPKQGKPGFASVDLNDAEVTQRVAHLRRALDIGSLNAMPRFDLGKSHELYVKLLQPVEAGWREAKNLIVVPHKALGQLPFSVLTTAPSASPTMEYSKAPWLIRRVAVSQLPSVSSLLALRRVPAPKPGRKEFIGFGDPFFSTAMARAANDSGTTRGTHLRNLNIEKVAALPAASLRDAPNGLPVASVANSSGLAQLARLEDTAEEIESIAKALKADPVADVFLRKAASKKNVKSGLLNDRRIVMFATHGLVPGDLDGLTEPALALSAPEVTGDAGESGLLTMGEVLGLKLNADWVVLSACNTASGNGAGSEAVSGLGKAFFYAGARSLLVSNWPVETVSARLLTTGLFEYQMNNPTASRSEALRATMLDLMDRSEPTKSHPYAHPMFWAPFSLVGDGGR